MLFRVPHQIIKILRRVSQLYLTHTVAVCLPAQHTGQYFSFQETVAKFKFQFRPKVPLYICSSTKMTKDHDEAGFNIFLQLYGSDNFRADKTNCAYNKQF